MFGYTGTYKGKEVSVMGSGMGIPSIGIYSYELYHFFDVDTIIRVGSCGALQEDVNLYDVIIAQAASQTQIMLINLIYQVTLRLLLIII